MLLMRRESLPEHHVPRGMEYVFGHSSDAIAVPEIEGLIAERQQAKLDRDYARADAIREQLLQQGVVLEDSREGTQWRRG